jgi:hypothetical protein
LLNNPGYLDLLREYIRNNVDWRAILLAGGSLISIPRIFDLLDGYYKMKRAQNTRERFAKIDNALYPEGDDPPKNKRLPID